MATRPRTLLMAVTLGVALSAGTAVAQPSMPSTFKTQTITTAAGADIFVRSGGSGPAVVLIHGYADMGDMWGPLAAALATSHTVIVPDLRGMGRSSHPATGYDKRTQAADIRAVLTALGHDRAAVVAHDHRATGAARDGIEWPGSPRSGRRDTGHARRRDVSVER